VGSKKFRSPGKGKKKRANDTRWNSIFINYKTWKDAEGRETSKKGEFGERKSKEKLHRGRQRPTLKMDWVSVRRAPNEAKKSNLTVNRRLPPSPHKKTERRGHQGEKRPGKKDGAELPASRHHSTREEKLARKLRKESYKNSARIKLPGLWGDHSTCLCRQRRRQRENREGERAEAVGILSSWVPQGKV